MGVRTCAVLLGLLDASAQALSFAHSSSGNALAVFSASVRTKPTLP